MVISDRRPVAVDLLLDLGECAFQTEVVAGIRTNEGDVYNVADAVAGFRLIEDLAEGGEEVWVVVDYGGDEAE